MNDHPLAELYRGPFEDLPPLSPELLCEHNRLPFDGEPCGCYPQEAASVRAAGTMDS